MSIRTRLFLWVSGLFLCVAVFGYFLENYVTKKELKKAQISLSQTLLKENEEQRSNVQHTVAEQMTDKQVIIDAVLSTISSFSFEMQRFAPTESNIQKGTWAETSDLLLNHKWIQYLQNTYDGKSLSTIYTQAPISKTYRVPIDDDLCWIYLGDRFYVGVRMPYSTVNHDHEHLTGTAPKGYMLFDFNELKASSGLSQPIFQTNTWPAIPVKWTEGLRLEVDAFAKAFQRARSLILSGKMQMPKVDSAAIDEAFNKQSPGFGILPVIPMFSEERVEKFAMKYSKVDLIWALLATYNTGIFGDDLFAFPTPSALTLFADDNPVGFGISTQDVCLSKPLFADDQYYEQNLPPDPQSNLANSIAVISLPHHLYLGNTLQLSVETPNVERKGYLTVGANIDMLMHDLVSMFKLSTFFVHDGKILSGYSSEGKKFDLSLFSNLSLEPFLQQQSGVITWNGVDYYFWHLVPFPTADIHFFLLNPVEKEFALLTQLKQGSEQVISTILKDLHYVGLVGLLFTFLVLHNISRRMTRPIIQLSQETEKVAQGRLDEVQFPKAKNHDEIAVLCQSFEGMVKGLQEREKVKGVLDKVVSHDIAQEILKGAVHLGGEEKTVTVLFADIRDFTKMTQNLEPHKVIGFLNTCMTKVSQIIDKNSGVVDKYIGDEVMALFGAPLSLSQAGLLAVSTAIEVNESLTRWNQERALQGLAPIELGIGIHTGTMLVGNMGAENRLNYTVIGSHVNLAARLCSAAKRKEILISKATLDEPGVKEKFIYEEIPAMAFKGFDQPVPVYRIQGVKT